MHCSWPNEELILLLARDSEERLLYNEYRVFPGGEVRPGRDADPSPPSSAEVKNRVEPYLYSP
jgi:hypothetical protein